MNQFLQPRDNRALEGCSADNELIERFLAVNDEAAFAELLRRYGPVVWGSCRRLLACRQDAEDAFQATFLVLMRRASRLSADTRLGPWLHGVAVMTARNVIRANRRRAAVTGPMDHEVPAPVSETPDAKLDLDVALLTLPERDRVPVVLCHLQGLTRREAAECLGCSEGTLSARLSRALAKLRARLGAGAPAAYAVGAMAVPTQLASATVRVAKIYSTSAQTATGLCPAVLGLTDEVLRMFRVKKLLTAVALSALAFGAAVCTSLAGPVSERPSVAAPRPVPRPARPARAAPVPPIEPREPLVMVWMKGRAGVYKADGTAVREWKGDEVPVVAAARLAPDGRTIAALREGEERQAPVKAVAGGAQLVGKARWNLHRLAFYQVDEKLKGTEREVPGSAVFVAWSPDGSKVFVGTYDDDGTYESYSEKKGLRYYTVNVRTGKHMPLELPAGHHLQDVSVDGKQFLTTGPDPKDGGWQAFLVPAGGGKPARLTDTSDGLYGAALAPSGERVFVWGQSPGVFGPGPVAPPPGKVEFFVDAVTVAGPKREKALPLDANEYVMSCRFSPDGKRLVSLRGAVPTSETPDPPRRVVVSDKDGKNVKPVLTIGAEDRALNVWIDWR